MKKSKSGQREAQNPVQEASKPEGHQAIALKNGALKGLGWIGGAEDGRKGRGRRLQEV